MEFCDVDQARKGILASVYSGSWRDGSAEGPVRQLQTYRQITAEVLNTIASLEVFAAEVADDQRTRRHIEGSIAWNPRHNHPACATLYPRDNRTGKSKEKLGLGLPISADRPIAVLDERMAI